MSQIRSLVDQREKSSAWFSVPFITFHFNNAGSTCNLRLIFINGLGTPVSWVSDFQVSRFDRCDGALQTEMQLLCLKN